MFQKINNLSSAHRAAVVEQFHRLIKKIYKCIHV